MVKQIRGQYSVRSPDLRPLYEEARRRIARLQGFEIAHVLRGRNRRADELANAAMDRGMGRGTGRDANRGPDRDIARSIGRAGQQERPGAVSPRGAAALPPEHRRPSPASPRTLRGVVRDGVVHLLEGELPEGALVKIARE